MKKRITNLILYLLSAFILAINFNLFLLPNNIVIGGITGIFQIINKFIKVDFYLILFVLSAIYALFVIIFRKDEKISKVLISAYFLPLIILITSIIFKNITINIKDNIILVLVASILATISSTLSYISGYSLDGSYISSKILSDKKNISYGNAIIYSNIIIVLISGIVFNFQNAIYGFVIMVFKALIVDKLLLGISDSKLFFIYTKKIKEVKKMIIDDLDTGVTILNVEGGFTSKKTKMLMCVVNTRDYYAVKEKILEIDNNAFILINDCYETKGGY